MVAATPEFPQDLHNSRSRVLSPPRFTITSVTDSSFTRGLLSGLAAGGERIQRCAGSRAVPCRYVTRVSVNAKEAERKVQETSASACNELLMTNDEGDRLKLKTSTDWENVHDSACPISVPKEAVS